ncbi:MAG: DUF11 domain-containing protein [Candidatus Omnitrophica bacterium]|nr:DUF11 domain-containing protein [Candidatus Omnitrophota bacterium]
MKINFHKIHSAQNGKANLLALSLFFITASLILMFVSLRAAFCDLRIPAGSRININTGSLNVIGTVQLDGTLQTSTGTVGMTGDWNNQNGTYEPNTGTVNFYGGASATQFIYSSGIGAGKLFYNLKHSGAGTAKPANSNLNVDGSFTNTAGTFDSNGYDMTIAQNWTNNGSFIYGARTVTLDGTPQDVNGQRLLGTTTFWNLTKIVSSASYETLIIDDALTSEQNIKGTLTLKGLATNRRLQIRSTSSWDPSPVQGKLNLNPGGHQDLDFLDVKDSHASGLTLVARIPNSADSGNNTNWSFGSTMVTWDGSISSDWSNPGNWNLGFVPVSGDSVTIPGTISPQPVLDAGAANPVVLTDLTFEAGGATGPKLTLNGHGLTVSDTLTMSTDANIYLIGNENVQITHPDTLHGTFNFVGDGNGNPTTITIPTGGVASFFNVKIVDTDNNKDIFRTSGNFTVLGDLTLTSGTLDISNHQDTLSVAGSLNVAGGTLLATNGNISTKDVSITSGTLTAPTAGTFNVSGNFSHTDIPSSIFNNNGGTVTLNGGNQNINGSTIFFGLTKHTPGATLTFEADQTQTIVTGGTLDLAGASGLGQELTLAKSGAGTLTNINLQTGATQALNYLLVQDNRASGLMLVARNSSGNGNTPNWSFGTGTFLWQGDISDNWNTPGNWELGFIPLTQDSALIPQVTGPNVPPKLYSGITIQDVTINSGGVLTLDGHDFVVNGTFTNNGNLQLIGNESTVTFGTYVPSGTVTYIGDNNGSVNTYHIKDFGTTDYAHLVIKDANATTPDIFDTTSNLNMTDLNVTNGTLTVSTGNTLTTSGLLTVDGGTLNAIAGNIASNGSVLISSGLLSAPGPNLNFTVVGDWTKSGGNFTHNSGLVAFNPTTQTTFTGNTTFFNIQSYAAGKTFKFTPTSTQTVEGTIDFRGGLAAGQKIGMLSGGTVGQKWSIAFPNGEQAVQYISVQDSDALNNTITCFSCQDLGNNNTNWLFYVLQINVPFQNRTINQRPTIIGNASPNQLVTIKGYSGGSFVTIGTVVSDNNGNFRLEASSNLDIRSDNELTPFLNTLQGLTVFNLNVIAGPTTNEVPTITSPTTDQRLSGAKPTIIGKGLAGQSVEVLASDALGNLLLSTVGIGTVDGSGNYNLTLNSPLVRALNFLSVTVNGVASNILEVKMTDPFGIVFDSTTNNPVKEAVVSLYRVSDNQLATVAAGDLDAGDVNPITTGSDGFYSYITASGNYYVRINAAGYDYPSGKTTFDAGRSIITGSKGENFTMAGAILDMDQPADANGRFLRVEKDANKKEVKIGEVITYTVHAENLTPNEIDGVYIEDKIPPGFKYIKGRVKLDDVPVADPTGERPLVFSVGNFPVGGKHVLQYQLVVGSGVTMGNYENVAHAQYSNGQLLSNQATKTVKVTLDPLFDMGTVIGKVFFDKNENGVQDIPEYSSLDQETYTETTVPNVRIVMEDGTVVTTDAQGRFSIPGIKPGRHLLRLDESSLPEGSYLTTDKVVIVDVTAGLMVKVNFGVNLDYNRFKSEDQQFFTAKVKVSQDRSKPSPRMNVSLFRGAVPVYDNVFLENAEFRIFMNYAPFVEKWRLEILDKDTRKLVKSFEGDRLTIHDPILWDGKDLTGEFIDVKRNYVYDVSVEDKKHDYDETVLMPISFNVLKDEDALKAYKEAKEKEDRAKSYRDWVKAESSKNNLFVQTILIDGERLVLDRLSGHLQNVRIMKDGQLVTEIPIAQKYGLTAKELLEGRIPEEDNSQDHLEVLLPKGDYDVLVQEGQGDTEISPSVAQNVSTSTGGAAAAVTEITGQPAKMYSKQVRVGEDYMFFVGMGDAKMGYAVNTGDIEPAQQNDKYKGGFWKEGSMAYYLRGKIKGKYLVTSSFDTDRQEKALFKSLNPDQYYPVYGDASQLNYNATDTQGPLYLMVEWDKSSVQWSNYSVGFDETEFSKYSRTLYGGKVNFESLSTTPYGESRSKVVAFTAEEKQRAAHNEFLATGGSLYFLKNKDIIEGSDKVRVEVRDKITGLVLSTTELKKGADYEIDDGSGRLLFWMPVPMLVQSASIISNKLLEGNLVYVVADYEYETADIYKEGTQGARVRQAVADNVLVGATYVKESQQSSNYQLKGTDVTAHIGKNMTVVGEYAETQANTIGNYISTDGGLSFNDLTTGSDTVGRAYGLKSDATLFNRLGLSAYYKWIDNNFASTDSVSQQGKELMGFQSVYDFNEKSRVTLRHDIQRLVDNGNLQTQTQVGSSQVATTMMQVVHEISKLKLTGEYQRTQTKEQTTDTAAVKADYAVNDRLNISLEKQVSLGAEGSPDQTTIGITATPMDKLTLTAQQIISREGMATTLGAKADMSEHFALTSEYSIQRPKQGATMSSGTTTTSIGTEMKINDKSLIKTSVGLARSSTGETAGTVAVKGTTQIEDNTSLQGEVAMAGAGPSRTATMAVGGGTKLKVNDKTDLESTVNLTSSTLGPQASTATIGQTTKVDEKTTTNSGMSFTDSTTDGQTTSYIFGTTRQLTSELQAVSSKSFGQKPDGTRLQDDTYSLVRDKDGRKLEGSLKRAYSTGATEVSKSNIFGLSGDINDKWAVTGSMEKGTVKNLDGTQTDRDAMTVALGYVNKNEETGKSISSSVKAELRTDSGAEDRKQYLIYQATEGQINTALKVFSKLELSKTRNLSGDFTEAQHREMMFGGAYRPVTMDRLNIIGRYTYLEEKSPQSQTDNALVEMENAHVIAAEAIYDLTQQWQLSEKFAFRIADEKVQGFDFNKTHTWLMIHRLNYRIDNDWAIGGEFRTLTQREAADSKSGVLVEVTRRLGDYAQLGVGYDFTDFADDLTQLSYKSQGPFMRMTGKFYDRTADEMERSKQKWIDEKIDRWAWALVQQEFRRSSSPVLDELNQYFLLAQKAKEKGDLERSHQIYKDIITAGQMMFEEAAEYIRSTVKHEQQLQEMQTLADQYFKNGEYEKAKKILEKILEETRKPVVK